MEAGCVVAAVMENAASGPQGEPGSGDVLEGDAFPSADLDRDDALPQAANDNPSGDKQQTSTAMLRSDDITELPAEPLLRSCVSTASMKVKNMQKLTFPRGHFPRLAECAHFHYENVDFGSVQFCYLTTRGQQSSLRSRKQPEREQLANNAVKCRRAYDSPWSGHQSIPGYFSSQGTHFTAGRTETMQMKWLVQGHRQLVFAEGQNEGQKAALESKELLFLIQITCQSRSWMVKRSYEDFRVLDKHLHLCIYDRRYSQLTELPRYDALQDTAESVTKMLATYLSRFSTIADNKINCGPVLTWMEIDNKGNHLLVSEEASINVPAIAAAHVTKRYTAQAADELTFEVGDIVSVIDMPPKEDTGWWRGKHGFQVGFFPCDCVELINDKIPTSVQNSVPKPVCKKHGKLVTFLRSFMKSRPPPQKLRQRGILRERVFGCDLGEHLHNSGHEVPQVVRSCAEFIEKHGVVDGIYRLSGISSNIQKLRHEFDSEQIPDLSRDVFRQDIHSVGSLCKLYFRELPNPLLTYQLYDRFSEAVSAATDEERLVKIHNVIQQLPPPHYRTLEFLMRHLSHLATFSFVTNMHTKNLAIVWAPNLLRSRQIESACFSGTAAFMEVRIQSVVVEFILNNTEALFSPKLNAIIRESTGNNTLARPKSLLVCSPSTKLLSLEEAQARTQAQLNSPATTPCLSHSDYIEVGEGPGALLGKFHTVIELPLDSSKRVPTKAKKSPVGNWLSFFHLGKSNSVSKRKLKRHPSEPNEIKSIALPGGRGDGGTLRSTKSEESLTSLHNVEGQPSRYRSLRPRSTSEAVSGVARSKDDLRTPPLTYSHNDSRRVRSAESPSPPRQEDELELCPPAAGIYSLDFDPMSFQCSPPSATSRLQHGRDANKWRKSAGCSTDSEPVSSPNNNMSYPQSPDISPVLGKGKKKVSGKALSPKLRKKSFKTQADVQAALVSTPIRGAASAPPAPCSSPSSPPAEGKEPRASFRHGSPLSTASQASAPTDLSQSAQNLPDPGTDRLMRSVSVLPPHPPLTSAARKLALALAESAQRAAHDSQWRNAHANLPFHPPQRQDAPHGHDRPPRPSILDLRTHPQEFRGPHAAPVSQWPPLESQCCPRPVRFLPAHLCAEPPQLADGQESACNFTPNVSPLGSGSFDEGSAETKDGREEKEQPVRGVRKKNVGAEATYQSVGVSTPTQPVCSPLSPSASPLYVNTDSINVFNFRAVLAETSVPPSLEELLPRPFEASLASPYSPEDLIEDVYSNRHHRPVHAGRMAAPHCPQPDALPHHFPGLTNVYRQSSESRYSSLGLRHPLSPQCRRYHGDEHLISGPHRQQGQWRLSGDGIVGHPAIRRARSFHAPQISHHELAETQVSPPNTVFYCEQASSQDAAFQRLVRAGLHPVRPQFDDARADYHYSDVSLIDGSCCYAAPWPRRGIRHSQSYTSRSTRASGQLDYYDYSPRRVPPVSREPYTEGADTGDYHADVYDRAAYQPVTNECRRKMTRTAVSPYESPVSPTGSRGRDVMHTRSMSDPGNGCLLSAERTESQHVVVATSPTSPRSRQADAEFIRRPIDQRSNVAPGPSRRIQIKDDSSQPRRAQRQPPLRKVPSLPERGGTNLKNVEHNDRSHTRSQDQERLIATNAAGGYAGILKPGILRRTGRSQSTRENRHCYHYHAKSPVDPEHLGSFSSQPTRRTRSAKVKPTQHDHMEGYYAAAKPKAARSGKAAAGYLPGPGYMSPHRHRLLSRALGHEAFYHAALRSDAGVYK